MCDLEAVVDSRICRNPVTPSIGLDQSEWVLSANDIATPHGRPGTTRARRGAKIAGISSDGERHA